MTRASVIGHQRTPGRRRGQRLTTGIPARGSELTDLLGRPSTVGTEGSTALVRQVGGPLAKGN